MSDPALKSPREIAEMVNHGNDVDDYERYLEYCELAAATAIEIERDRCLKLLESDLPIADAIAHIRSGSAPPTLPPGYAPKMRVRTV